MCIVLISTEHPQYPLILASNRDEHLARPTAAAAYWDPPHQHVLGGRDLFRPVKGTWLGLTKDGRIATLTNFREDQQAQTEVSRGAMVNAFLTPSPEEVGDTETFVKRLIGGEGARGSGGFSLVCGRIGQPLAVVSNRMQKEGEVKWIGKDKAETVGLSNATFGDRSWDKVAGGEQRMQELLKNSQETQAKKEEIIEGLLRLLSIDTLPKHEEGECWISRVRQLRRSIFIPRVGHEDGTEAQAIAAADHDAKVTEEKATSGAYGTQKQTVVLVDQEGLITFVEKSLYDEEGQDISRDPRNVRKFELKIDFSRK
ncbi:MAG: hypothetical protein LQ340_003739 [Diploschistes diacapsis]|nr:MAG: hypothetical protein LQ340_003739 [Diploschistes diacapsis]